MVPAAGIPTMLGFGGRDPKGKRCARETLGHQGARQTLWRQVAQAIVPLHSRSCSTLLPSAREAKLLVSYTKRQQTHWERALRKCTKIGKSKLAGMVEFHLFQDSGFRSLLPCHMTASRASYDPVRSVI